MKTTPLPSVKEVVKEVANIQPKNVYTPDWQSMLTRDRNQAYTRLVEGIDQLWTHVGLTTDPLVSKKDLKEIIDTLYGKE